MYFGTIGKLWCCKSHLLSTGKIFLSTVFIFEKHIPPAAIFSRLLKENISGILSVIIKISILHGVGKAEIQGEVLLGDYQLHLHQEDSVMVGEDLVYSLILTPFINSVSCLLCQPPFWGCQSRPKLVPQEAEAVKADGNRCHKRFLLARHIHTVVVPKNTF